LSVWCN